MEHSSSSSPLADDSGKVYRATAASVRERLVNNWDSTYAHFNDEDPKQAYYISMEFLQVRVMFDLGAGTG